MRFIVLFIFSFLSLFSSHESIAQKNRLGLPIQSVFESDDINLYQQTWSILQDEKGKILIANASGLLIFDGFFWKSLHIGNNRHIHSLDLDEKGRIFVGGIGEFGYFRSDELNNLVYISLSDSLSKEVNFTNVRQTHVTSHGVYFRTNNFLFRWFEGEVTVLIDEERLYVSKKVHDDIVINKVGEGLKIISGGKLLDFFYDEKFNSKFMTSILYMEEDDSYKIFYWSGEIISYKSGKALPFQTESNLLLSNKGIRAAIKYENGFVIAHRESGLIILDESGDLLYSINEQNGLVNERVVDLFLDNEAVLWVSTDGGFSTIYLGASITLYDDKTGFNGNIKTIKRFRNIVFIGTTTSLIALKESKEHDSLFEVVLSNEFVNSMVATKNEFLVGTNSALYLESNGLLHKIFDSKIHHIKQVPNFPNKFILATQNGIYLAENESEWLFESLYEQQNFVPQNLIVNENELCFSHFNVQIICLANFLSDSPNQRFYKTKKNIRDLRYIGGVLTTATDNGLYRAVGLNKSRATSDLLKVDDRFSDLMMDTTQQVFTFLPSKYDDELIWIRVNKVNGKLKLGDHSEIIKTPFSIFDKKTTISEIFEDSSGVIWFGGNERLYRYDDNIPFSVIDFKTNITDIYVNRDSLIYGGFGEPVKPITLSYEDNEVRFNYAAASYIDPERNIYSYKLEGFDSDWSEWSLETQKDYTNIPEGDYIFKVRSRNVFEVDGKPDQIAFTVLPPWYRTWWAYMLYFISFSGLLYTGYKIRVNQLLKVERMRTKIASDLHDEVSATLTGISYFAEAIKRDEDQSKAAHFVSLISESAGDAKEKITDIVWSINPENDNWELFLSKCRRFASDLLESKELEYTLNITEHVPGKLSMEVRQHLWMIFKEMVTNAVRHSKATRLDVIMDVENGMLKLIVQDNGIGFDLDEIREGNGVRNIRKRAVKIGATVNIHSEEDFGTRWRMELPL